MKLSEHLNQTIEELKAIITAKYPNATFKNPYQSLRNHYDSRGMIVTGTFYQCDFGFTATAPESSHPKLKPSISRVDIKITYEGSRRDITLDFPIDSVDVHYGRLDKKINRKNITLARKFNRQVIKWSMVQLRKKVSFALTLPATVEQSLVKVIAIDKEKSTIRSCAQGIVNEMGIHQTGRFRSRFTPQHGITKDKNTFYHNGTKVGSKKFVRMYIIQHIDQFMHNFEERCPYILKKIQNELA